MYMTKVGNNKSLTIRHSASLLHLIDFILQALEEGAFYSSCGPEIYDFWFRDGRVYVDCSDAVSVSFHTLRMPLCKTAGEHVTHAECDVYDGIHYVRAVVTDAQGRCAWTNPIFLR